MQVFVPWVPTHIQTTLITLHTHTNNTMHSLPPVGGVLDCQSQGLGRGPAIHLMVSQPAVALQIPKAYCSGHILDMRCIMLAEVPG